MDLLLGLQSSSAIAWCGTSDTMIGTLKSGESVSISLKLIPLETGLIVSTTVHDKSQKKNASFSLFQVVSGLQLTDTFLKRVHEYEDTTYIFVSQPD